MDELDYKGNYLHSSFSLDENGGKLTLFDAATPPLNISKITYPPLSSFYSWGFIPSTGGWGYLFPHSPGKLNAPTATFVGMADKPSPSPSSNLRHQLIGDDSFDLI